MIFFLKCASIMKLLEYNHSAENFQEKFDYRITSFNKEKITAIYKTLVANGQPDHKITDDFRRST